MQCIQYRHERISWLQILQYKSYKSYDAVKSAVDELQELMEGKLQMASSNIIVSNMVASFELLKIKYLNLIKLHSQLKDNGAFKVFYEPELSNGFQGIFPGSTRVIIHASGKGIVTGARYEEDIYIALSLFCSYL